MTYEEFRTGILDIVEFADPDRYEAVLKQLQRYVDGVEERQAFTSQEHNQIAEISTFLEAFYERRIGARCSIRRMVQVYVSWCKLKGTKGLNPMHFGRMLSAMGFKRNPTLKYYLDLTEKAACSTMTNSTS